MELSDQQLDLIRQWYHAVVDTNSGYLNAEDHALAAQIMRQLGWEKRFPATLKRAERLAEVSNDR